MTISATLKNGSGKNETTVDTDGKKKSIVIPAKPDGQGSSVNGGELLFLALATCFCNDLYREGARRGIVLNSVEVTVSGFFGKEGEPASNIAFKVDVQSDAPEQAIDALISDVDRIAEIHNTLRHGATVTLLPR